MLGNNIIAKLIYALEQARNLLKAMVEKENTLYDTAHGFLGQDASPSDVAPDEYGCAESVSRVVQTAFPDIRFPLRTSTREMLRYLISSSSFVQVDRPQYGCIILSATGTGNGSVLNGHTGIMGKNESPDGSPWIMSNDSRNGLWSANYTLKTWRAYYEKRGGMPTHFFLPK